MRAGQGNTVPDVEMSRHQLKRPKVTNGTGMTEDEEATETAQPEPTMAMWATKGKLRKGRLTQVQTLV